MQNTLIDLHCGSAKVATTAAQLKNALEAEAEGGGRANAEIFVTGNVDMSEVADMLDWEANDEQTIYLVAGANVTGLELGANVRYIAGARDAEGKLVVTDKDGNAIGTWNIAEGGASGAFVAA